jgi:hypothetical protein
MWESFHPSALITSIRTLCRAVFATDLQWRKDSRRSPSFPFPPELPASSAKPTLRQPPPNWHGLRHALAAKVSPDKSSTTERKEKPKQEKENQSYETPDN